MDVIFCYKRLKSFFTFTFEVMLWLYFIRQIRNGHGVVTRISYYHSCCTKLGIWGKMQIQHKIRLKKNLLEILFRLLWALVRTRKQETASSSVQVYNLLKVLYVISAHKTETNSKKYTWEIWRSSKTRKVNSCWTSKHLGLKFYQWHQVFQGLQEPHCKFPRCCNWSWVIT